MSGKERMYVIVEHCGKECVHVTSAWRENTRENCTWKCLKRISVSAIAVAVKFFVIEQLYNVILSGKKLSIVVSKVTRIQALKIQASRILKQEVMSSKDGALTMSIYRDFMVPWLCQFTEISWCPDYVNLQRFHGALTMSIYRDFMVPWLCQFTEISWCPDYLNLQRFYGALTMSIYRDFMVPRLCQFTEISWCPDYLNLQRFYGALTMSIYRDFMVPRLCQFTEILWCPEYVNLQRFCKDLWCPDYANLQRFYDTLTMSIYKDCTW